MSSIKLLGSEATCNSTPNSYSSPVVRLVNKGATAHLVTIKEKPKTVSLVINATANDTTLLTLKSGTNTDNLSAGMYIVNSSNVAVINTGVSSVIANIVNSTAVAVNVDIVIATGNCDVYAVTAIKSISMVPNSELLLVKGSGDYVESNNSTNVLCVGVALGG